MNLTETPSPGTSTTETMWIAILLTILVFAITFSLHYGALYWSSQRIRDWNCPCYPALILSVVVISCAHAVEAALFAAAFWIGDELLAIGSFDSVRPMDWMSYFYFSLVNYTTLGRGDVLPTGHLRFIAGFEAFAGFLLITASGAFLMQVMAGHAPLHRRP